MMKLLYMLLMISVLVVDGKKTNKVTGGLRTGIEDYPSQVSLHTTRGRLCGGTIISRVHILTAANCPIIDLGNIIGNIKILSGTNDQHDILDANYISEVAYVIYHPEYNPRAAWINDICILKLTKPIEYSRVRESVELPIFYHTNARFKITGWGTDKVDRKFRRFLHFIDARVLSSKTCRKYLESFSLRMSDSQSCAVGLPITNWVSNGDGGGGMIYHNTIYGIISIRIPNKSKTFVFTRVSYFSDWIRRMMNTY